MYDFVDRPIDQLNESGAVALHGMRVWVRRRAAGQCPCAEMRNLFIPRGFGASLAGFGTMMNALHGGARRNITFLPVTCARIGEDEAVLLALLRTRDATSGPRDQAAISLVVGARLPHFLQGVEALARGFESRGGPPRVVGERQCGRMPGS